MTLHKAQGVDFIVVDSLNPLHQGVLYSFTMLRDELNGGGFKQVPLFDDFTTYMKSMPFKHWWLVTQNKQWCGSLTLSKSYEITINLLPSAQRKGIGRACIAHVRKLHPRELLIARFGIDNAPAKRLFDEAGFIPTEIIWQLDGQLTLEKEVKDDETSK